jgi:Na+/glutamate symporter
MGIALLVFFAIAALLLGYEHRVHLFVANGLLVLLLLGCVGMHFFMHGGHGDSHKGGDADSRDDRSDKP